MEKITITKSIIFYILFLATITVSSQKLTFKIQNDTINKKVYLSSIDDEVLKSIIEKENSFVVDYLGFDEGYYLLKKDENVVVLYLKPTDDITISFDNENFYKSLTFTGEGAYINTYLLNKKSHFINKKGKVNTYYKKEFYEGDENKYLDKLDRLYKENYGTLFSGQLDKKFVDEEMKNLQYAYSLDLLKYEGAKKHYQYKDSLAPSSYFLEPLNHIHFQNNQLYEKYNSYKELTILKWKKDIENAKDYGMMNQLINDIRIPSLKQGVLESLYYLINTKEVNARDYYRLIKLHSQDIKLETKAKEKYDEIRQVEAEKNLSKFKFKNANGEQEQLVKYKGKYIFINFWTNRCKTCEKRFKDLDKLQAKFEEKNIAFVSISIDKKEQYEDWLVLLKEQNIQGNQLFLDSPKLKFIKAYNITALPSTVIISKKGVPTDIEIEKISSKKTQKIIEALLEE